MLLLAPGRNDQLYRLTRLPIDNEATERPAHTLEVSHGA